MAKLMGAAQAIELGEGYAVRAPGIEGEASLERPRNDASRGARAAEEGTPALDAAFASTDVTEVRQIEVRVKPTVGPPPQGRLRSADSQDLLELRVPDLGDETGQLVLACDETGVLTWHLPVDEPEAAGRAAARGAGSKKRFLVPATSLAPPPSGDGTKRSLIGAVGRKLMKVLVYPVTDPILGAVSDHFAGKWEKKNRPYGLRTMSPTDFRDKGAGAFESSEWARLTSGRALLFVHGTFSTAHGGFADIPDPTFAQLHTHYGGRVLAFNHPTLSDDPKENVAWLLSKLPTDRSIELDVVCHSRGGLVARTLAEQPSAFGLDNARLSVKRIVFVGVPNQGTILADPDHMVKMLDRFTSALNLFPTGPVTETLESIITAVKMIGHGALKGLGGLASMRPDGPFLQTLNAATSGGVDYFGIAADYEPQADGLKALVSGTVADVVIDRVFQDAANDLVVPEHGVWGRNGSSAFPIQDDRVLRLDPSEGVLHTKMFAHPTAAARMVGWLTSP